jgi:hypothetical protein
VPNGNRCHTDADSRLPLVKKYQLKIVETVKIMLSEIERIFPNNCKNMKIDIDDVIGVRKNRSKLFNENYFANKFWDIILVLYSHEVNDSPINAQGISAKLDVSHSKILRYLGALSADDIICAYDQMAEDYFDIAHHNLSLTRVGFENAGSVIQQMRRVFAQSDHQHG